jgi:CheY-like chemotaxis protein
MAPDIQRAPVTFDRIRARGTAIVVDDDEVSRLATRQRLRSLGFVAVGACDSAHAIRIRECGVLIDLIVIVSMSAIGGAECYRRLQVRALGVPMVLLLRDPTSCIADLEPGLVTVLTERDLADALDRIVAPATR